MLAVPYNNEPVTTKSDHCIRSKLFLNLGQFNQHSILD